MALYQLTSGSTVIRTSDNLNIPADPQNMDYRAYLAWVALGNTPDPAPPAPADNSPILASYNAGLVRQASRLTAAGKTAEALQILLQLQQGGN